MSDGNPDSHRPLLDDPSDTNATVPADSGNTEPADADGQALAQTGDKPEKPDNLSLRSSREDVTIVVSNGGTKVTLSPSDLPDDHGYGLNGDTSAPGSVTGSSRRRIAMEEFAPSASSIIDEYEPDWRMSLQLFSSKKRGKQKEDKHLPRSIRKYYRHQDEMITAFEEMQLEVDDAMENAEDNARLRRVVSILSRVSFLANLILLVIKAVAGGISGSLAVISAVIDSAVDLVSGALMWWSNRAVKHRDIYQYPQGRTKLEPIAIVVLSVIMASASIQMIREAIEQVIDFALFDLQGPLNLNGTDTLCLTLDEIKSIVVNGSGPLFGVIPVVICCITIVVKLVLFLVCYRIKSPSIQALAQDHRNDVLSNSIALACGLIGGHLWKYADPLGAVGISVYIIVSWFMTGWQQIKMLTGVTARPDFLKKITWIALNHHTKVEVIDTVRAFHFGNNFLVEVDIVLPKEMSLKESHDIGETLQLKLEKLPEIERAFVHLDYEWEHHPWSEHKQV